MTSTFTVIDGKGKMIASGPGAVTITGLSPSTLYHYRMQIGEPAPYSLDHLPKAKKEHIFNKVKVEKDAYVFFAKNYTDEQEQAIRKWCRSQGKGRVHCRKDANALWITFKAADDGLVTMFQLQFKE